MNRPKDYDDIPGTYVFDGSHHRKGYALNMFCKSLDLAENRESFRRDPLGYLQRHPMTEQQHAAVMQREWLEMLRLGGNIYYTFKLAIFDGFSMQQAGAAMSGNGMSLEAFQKMMLDGGRSIVGNRSKKEQMNG